MTGYQVRETRHAVGGHVYRLRVLSDKQQFADPEQVGTALSESIAQGDWRLFFLTRDRVKALNVADVQSIIETAIGGKDVTTLYEGERRYSVVVRFPAQVRQSAEAIGNTLLPTPGGAQVPLSSLATIALVDGPAQISRESGKRRVVVGANVEGRDLAGFVTEVQQRIDQEVKLPEGYYFVYGGQFENMERAMATLAIIVPLTIAAIFFLLFILFRSVKLAGLIILVLPFASIGGLIGLFVSGEYVSVPASVGFIALWGIAVLNGVVMVEEV